VLILVLLLVSLITVILLLPRYMECRRGLAIRILSVCLSVKRVDCDKTEEQSVQIFIPNE